MVRSTFLNNGIKLRISSFCIVFIFFVLFTATQSSAATVNDVFAGIANFIPVIDSNVQSGDIVAFSSKGYILSRTEYDQQIVGVIINKPAISLETSNAQKTFPVVSTGTTLVNVSSVNGNINKGDSITSSKVPGIGMRTTKAGYILGNALESYSSNNKKAVKKIQVNLSIHYFTPPQSLVGGSFFDVVNLSALATYQEPLKAFKYLIAALTVILSFVFAFFSFARTATKGLEALGRNPLASRMIQAGILFNIFIAVAIVFAGLTVAFIMIRL